jgi:hypothetical protein
LICFLSRKGEQNAKLSDLQGRTTLLITIIKPVQFSFGERMEPLLNCPENEEHNLSGSYIERNPQAKGSTQHQPLEGFA